LAESLSACLAIYVWIAYLLLVVILTSGLLEGDISGNGKVLADYIIEHLLWPYDVDM
jgi:hypothetical protein